MLSLTEALAALPDTADGIAVRFAAQGIKGARNEEACCPIANYLTGLGFVGACVLEDEVQVDDEDLPAETSEAMGEFVRRFDGGAWPELVAEVAG